MIFNVADLSVIAITCPPSSLKTAIMMYGNSRKMKKASPKAKNPSY
jgi:hypothetical protein